jgi:circadian clock protein KaiC
MTSSAGQKPALVRIPTGVGGLDTILQGGLFQGGLYVVRGLPGTGKTILSNQIAFNHVASGGRVVYISLLAETNSRLLAYLRSLSFFQDAPIGDALQYFSASHVLESMNFQELHQITRQAILDRHPTLIVLDGLAGMASVAQSPLELKRFARSLQALLETTGCTALLLQDAYDELYALDATVDGVIVLSASRIAVRSVRELEVTKFRGGGVLEGRHQFDITQHGLVVFPRTEVLLRPIVPSTVSIRAHEGRLGFEIRALDAMLQGGVPEGSTTMLLGSPGSGRTLLGLHFLMSGARHQEPGLYFGFNEPPAELISAAARVGLDLTPALQEGTLELIWQPAFENLLDALSEQLLAAVRRRQVRRLFIDGAEGFQKAALPPERLQSLWAALTAELRALDVTTLFSLELLELVSSRVEIPMSGVSMLADNIIFVRYVEMRSQLFRLISIMKMRRSGYDAAIRAFVITDRGIAVTSPFDGAAGMLTGEGRVSSSAAGQEGLPGDTPESAEGG